MDRHRGALGAAGLVSIAAAALAARGTVRWVSAAALAIVAISLVFAPAHPERFRLWLYDTLAEKPVREGNRQRPRRARDHDRPRRGVGATASVFERISPSGKRTRDFAINGKKEASTDFEALRNQLVLGHLPMLLHRDPKNALVVGLGAGVTAGAVAVHPGAHVTVAELNPEVARATREFADANHGVLDRPNVSLVFEDGRRVVRDASTRAGARATT